MNETSYEIHLLRKRMEDIELEICDYLERQYFFSGKKFDQSIEVGRIRQVLSDSDFMQSGSPTLIGLSRGMDQPLDIASAFEGLGYVCAARLLLEAGLRDRAWSALLDAQDHLGKARMASMKNGQTLSLDERRVLAEKTKNNNATRMREFIADALRKAADGQKWTSPMQAARAVVDEAAKYGNANKLGIFRIDYPVKTIEGWMTKDPIVSGAFWDTCQPQVKAAAEAKRRRWKAEGR